jgi:hypothetical protein
MTNRAFGVPWRVLATALALLAGTTFAVVGGSAEPAGATGGYPHPTVPCAHAPYATTGFCPGYDWGPVHADAPGYTVATTYSARGYGYRNCTDYVAWKLESLGISTA